MWEKFYVLELIARLLGGSPCYPIDLLIEQLILNVGLLFHLRYYFLTFKYPGHSGTIK
jgi:hypothetical protein